MEAKIIAIEKAYIARGEAFGAVQDHFQQGGFKSYEDGQRCMNRIKDIPAAEVAEVVRCRDCKHYDSEDGDQKCVKDAEWVEEDACYYGFISYHEPEFYCADGEKR